MVRLTLLHHHAYILMQKLAHVLKWILWNCDFVGLRHINVGNFQTGHALHSGKQHSTNSEGAEPPFVLGNLMTLVQPLDHFDVQVNVGLESNIVDLF